MEALFREAVPAKTNELKASAVNLQQISAYCRSLFTNPNLSRDEFQRAAEQSRSFALQSVSALAYQLNQFAQAFDESLGVQVELLDQQANNLDLLSQVHKWRIQVMSSPTL